MDKRKKKTIIISSIACAVFLILYLTFIRGFYASSNRIMGPYLELDSYEEFISYDYWAIGQNLYGEPIFCFEDNAFMFTKEKYRDEFNNIYELYHDELNLHKINKHNVDMYKKLAYTLASNNEGEDNRYNSLIKLLDVYENGQKRWLYKKDIGFVRIFPYLKDNYLNY